MDVQKPHRNKWQMPTRRLWCVVENKLIKPSAFLADFVAQQFEITWSVRFVEVETHTDPVDCGAHVAASG